MTAIHSNVYGSLLEKPLHNTGVMFGPKVSIFFFNPYRMYFYSKTCWICFRAMYYTYAVFLLDRKVLYLEVSRRSFIDLRFYRIYFIYCEEILLMLVNVELNIICSTVCQILIC